MADERTQIQVGLPETLSRQFVALKHRLWRIETAVALAIGVSGLLASYLVLFISDRFWDTPGWMRALILLGGLAVGAWAAWRWARNWFFKPRDQRDLAIIVQRKYRLLGDRLLGIVELADESRRPPHFSPALYRAAIDQVATEANRYDFEKAVSERRARRQALVVVALLGVVLVPVVAVPPAGWNALVRWAAPFSDHPRFTMVELDGLPGEQVVAHGEPFEIAAGVIYRSFWKPRQAMGRVERQMKLRAPIEQGRVLLTVPGQVQPGVLKIRIGDAVRELAILPHYRPSLKELTASVVLPDYLKYPPAEESAQSGVLTVLEGSRVSFTGKTTRDLAAAQFEREASEPQELAVEGERFLSDAAGVDAGSNYLFEWQDVLGLKSAAPWRLNLQTEKDMPPIPEFAELSREVAILETEVLELKARGRDDFGVRLVGYAWEFALDWQQAEGSSSREFRIQAESPQEKQFQHSFHFSPRILRIPPDSVVELQSYATDYFPRRQPVLSPVYRVLVLGTETHAEMIRQRLESLLVRLEEITRLEEKIMAGTANLTDPEKMKSDDAAEQIERVRQEQLQNAAALDQVAKDGMQTLREAIRNPTLPEQMLREWAQTVQAMQQLAGQQMQEAADSLKSAQENSASRPEDLAEALKKEEEILNALAEMQKNTSERLDDLQALTLAQRLRKISLTKVEITKQLQKFVPETIGMLPEELPENFQKVNATLALEQDTVRNEAQVLEGEISRFFERTQKPNYEKVSTAIKEARTIEELESLSVLIRENIAMEASRNLTTWSQRFNEWADILEPKSEGGGEGAGEGGDQEMEDLTKQLIALIRLRHNEMNLYEQTKLLDAEQADEEFYKERAGVLSDAQRKLTETLSEIHEATPIAVLEEPFVETRVAMDAVATLLDKPQTDEVTGQAQVKAIELISDLINLINEQAQRQDPSGSGESQADEMAFLMQMMAPGEGMEPGEQTGSSPGGSTQGGTTDQAATASPGDPRGQRGDARSAARTTGAVRESPAEFREALENYFHGIEQEQK
jgi:hypothetical protein